MKRVTLARIVLAPFSVLLSLSAIAVAQGDAPGKVRTQASAEAELAARKIDPEITHDLERSQIAGLRAGVRVIIELEPRPQDVSFETAISIEPALEVAGSVAARQLEFVDDLGRTPGLVGRGGVEIIDYLTLQYAVVAIVGNQDSLNALARRADIRSIQKDQLNQPLTVQGRILTGSDVAAAAGHDGGGIGVAVIDTHFDLQHPELGGSNSLPNGVVFAGQNFSDPGTPVYSQNFSDCFHGTGTASIVRRYAPGVDLYCHTVFPNAFDSVIANSINWCITNKNGANGGAPIRVISMSLGGGRNFSECNSGVIHDAAGSAVTNGIIVFAASGNDGWSDSMGSPACSNNVISVGSVWDETGANYSPFPPANCSDNNRLVDERTCYSDTASFLDIYAPSEEVICAQCGGGTFALGGTSSACPAAAGLTAQLLDANPALIGDKNGVTALYQSTGATVTGDSSKRRINLTAAIGGGGGGGPTALADGATANYTVATGAITEYTIDIPANASNLQVTITGSGDADLYVKRQAINWPAEQGQHTAAEFKAPYIGGSAESVTFASPAADTWNVLIHGFTAASGTIVATWDVATGGGGPTALANGTTVNYSVATGNITEFTIPVPANSTSLSVSITGSGDADLYVKRQAINWPAEQGAHNTSEFQAQYIGGSSESVSFTNPAQDTWNVLIHGFSGNPSGTVVANWQVSSGTPEWHYEGYVRETPHNYGNNSTYSFTYSSPGASQVALHFATLNTESNYDFLSVYDVNGALLHRISGNLISNGSGSAFGRTDGWVVVQGSEVRVELVTDSSVTRYGYKTDTAAAYY